MRHVYGEINQVDDLLAKEGAQEKTIDFEWAPKETMNFLRLLGQVFWCYTVSKWLDFITMYSFI